MRFPTVTGANLSGRRFELPAGFEGELNLVQVAYLQWQQASVDSWTPLLAILTRRHPNLRAYELPVLRRMSWVQQLMIDGGMRMGIPDRAVRDRTITLYLDVERFNAALAIPGVDTIQNLLVDRDGNILWRAAGDYSYEHADELARTVAHLAAQAA
jgi:hypothetical protein